MKNNLIILLLILFVLSSCTNQEEINDNQNNDAVHNTPLKISEINSRIQATLSKTNTFEWNATSDLMLWSALVHGNNILTIGYGHDKKGFSEERSQNLINTKESILKIIAKTEGFDLKKERSHHVIEHEIINAIDVKVQNIETLIALRQADNIRYLEPSGYNKFGNESSQRSTIGCDQNPENINPSHYGFTSPSNVQIAWNFYKHNIPDAWEFSTGQGITIGLIDTGISPFQNLLNPSGFNDGDSNGRSIEKKGTFIDSPWWWSNNDDGPHDKCGHGTAMASTMASPRNDDGMPLGVAYNSNLIAYRATQDVLLNDYHERYGVSRALIELANRSEVKIISMSIGWVWSIGNISDAVRYAHSKGKLIFAAGGTSTSFTNWYGVTFPASMDEVVAVTGVDDGPNYDRCSSCHSGNKIDFTIIMEGDNDTSKAPTVLGFSSGERKYTGGSSVATATTAGIAALVWSKNPNWNRNEVLNKLKESSDLYPNRSSQFGFGNIDALKAVK